MLDQTAATQRKARESSRMAARMLREAMEAMVRPLLVSPAPDGGTGGVLEPEACSGAGGAATSGKGVLGAGVEDSSSICRSCRTLHSLGTLPVKSFPVTFKTCSRDSSLHSRGKLPLKLLPFKYNLVRVWPRALYSGGRVPSSVLSLKTSWSAVRVLHSGGRVPDSALPLSWRLSRDSMALHSAGSPPATPLLPSPRRVSFPSEDQLDGRGPVTLFSFKSKETTCSDQADHDAGAVPLSLFVDR
mmetsp:Transcript_5770/g.16205  ORF Transcript_5770/g.16205 Transcript_5770/m.16205 type:complete len:244 (-) Transcript_5770:900-1631(-)